jgi:hypothetical protein
MLNDKLTPAAAAPLVTSHACRRRSDRWREWPKFLFFIALLVTCLQVWLLSNATYTTHDDDDPSPPSTPLESRKRPKIAIMSGFVPSTQTKTGGKFTKFDDLINKACYAHIWGYDFIFNTTDGFSDHPTEHRHWLTYGTWHRVPHVQSILPDYDWVLYADTDYLIKDVTRPLESFLNEFEFYGKSPDIFLPRDGEHQPANWFAFSAFAFLIKSSPFSTRLLQNWMEFAFGLCPAGNYRTNKKAYSWTDSDQPGLWYALTKTHMEFFPPPNNTNQEISGMKARRSTPLHLEADLHTCNKTTGLIESTHHDRTFGPDLQQYFRDIHAVGGNFGSDLSRVPDEQPIIWSRNRNDSRSGLGLQMTWGAPTTTWPLAFAIHKKKDWPADMVQELDICKTRHGCYARYNAADKLEIGCHNNSFQVA